MLILQGTLIAAQTLPGRTDKKTGEVYAPRDVVQVQTLDPRGLVQISTITVPAIAAFSEKIGKTINLPVRAWAPGATVNYMYENTVQGAV